MVLHSVDILGKRTWLYRCVRQPVMTVDAGREHTPPYTTIDEIL